MADLTNPDWRSTLKRRLTVLAVVFACWAAAIDARLVYLQVISHDEMVMRADGQQKRTVVLPAKRGEIVDRNGRLLAYSVDADTIYAVPVRVDDPPAAAAALCRALDDCDARSRPRWPSGSCTVPAPSPT